ncbi:uncharacterized protein LOC143886065 [Tasmannia lanceolata]|uniref:uncharacterized protein LOC143886065 n=1 Tax=Tasmannia lanceolata TaxID=3420 RepID=UPI0040633EE7
MSKVEIDQIINHFSHDHPLELSNLQQQSLTTPSCSGCKLKVSGWIYTCKTCNYTLHITCSQMPRRISHPVDPKHSLTLFPSPVYPEGTFKCNACGQLGTGFCFHCTECDLDIHIICASRQLSVKHGAHHHTLNLTFSPPYNEKAFKCDICNETSSNNWLYRCDLCQFDAHMNCTIAKPKSKESGQIQQQQWREMSKVEIDQIIHHFSHEHPLELTNLQQQTPIITSCSGCKVKVSGWVYNCKTCNYTLHITCSQMPRRISHPVDPKHSLTLFPYPIYPEGAFKCNACGKLGTGFCFHCTECDLDIHIICASRQLSVKHGAHRHPLNLTFSPPYNGKVFKCDICYKTGSNHWLYRCDLCDFDAHMNCAMAKSKAKESVQTHCHHHHQQQQQPQSQIQELLVGSANGSRSINRGIPYVHPHYHQHQEQQVQIPYMPPQFPILGIGSSNEYQAIHQMNMLGSCIHQFGQPLGRSGSANSMMGHVVQEFMGGLSQQAGQAIVQGIMGGGSLPGIDIGSGLGIGSAILSSVIGLN